MFNVLIDTCVWLDLATDPKQRGMLEALEAFIALGHIRLIVPQLVVDEFEKNRDRVAKASAKSISSQVQQVKEAVKNLELHGRRKESLLAGLDEVKHKAPLLGGAAEQALRHIEHLFKATRTLATTSSAKMSAAERGLARKAPCHHDNKNSIADAVLIELYAEAISAGKKGERYAFVTHNKSDFSGLDHRQPHNDIAPLFTKIKSLYFVNLSELFARIDPSAYSEIRWEQSWQQEPRTLAEMQEAEDRLHAAVWYNRHMTRAQKIEAGQIKVLPKEEWERLGRDNKHYLVDSIWDSALKAAEKVRAQYGKDNLGPWDDFEWGMINGKLSAIRWVLGDDWDMLDT